MNSHGTPTSTRTDAGASGIHVRSLDEHLSADQSFSSAYARAVGAIAGSEGKLTLAQFAAVTDLAGDGKSSAVFTALVLDEPAAGLTAPDIKELMAIIRKIREHGITIILIEHHIKVGLRSGSRLDTAVLYGKRW